MVTNFRLRPHNLAKMKQGLPLWAVELLDQHPIMLAGGYWAAHYSGLMADDMDFFIYNDKGDSWETIVKPFIAKTGAVIEKLQGASEHLCWTLTLGKQKIQFVKTDLTSCVDILNMFDLLTVRLGLTKNAMFGDRLAIKSALKKEIKFARIDFPVVALKRLLKYHDKGYSIKDEDMQDFVEKVHARLLTFNLVDDTMTRESVMRTFPRWSGN